MENLTQENFWNDLHSRFPGATQIFCDWVDKYKLENDWDSLFDPELKFHDLPHAFQLGMWFEFMVTVTSTSVGYKVITGAAAELMVGQIVNCDTDSSDAVAIWKALVGSSYIAVILGGADTTKGGIKGDRFKVTNVNSTTWVVEGNTNATGTVATPFSAT